MQTASLQDAVCSYAIRNLPLEAAFEYSVYYSTSSQLFWKSPLRVLLISIISRTISLFKMVSLILFLVFLSVDFTAKSERMLFKEIIQRGLTDLELQQKSRGEWG